MVLPEVHALHERLLVAALLVERRVVERGAVRDGLGDEPAVPVELVVRDEVRDHDEAVALEGRHRGLIEERLMRRARAHRRSLGSPRTAQPSIGSGTNTSTASGIPIDWEMPRPPTR